MYKRVHIRETARCETVNRGARAASACPTNCVHYSRVCHAAVFHSVARVRLRGWMSGLPRVNDEYCLVLVNCLREWGVRGQPFQYIYTECPVLICKCHYLRNYFSVCGFEKCLECIFLVSRGGSNLAHLQLFCLSVIYYYYMCYIYYYFFKCNYVIRFNLLRWNDVPFFVRKLQYFLSFEYI